MSNWQQQLASAITDPQELADRLAITLPNTAGVNSAVKDFTLRVPECFVDRMEKGNPSDPLLLQVLPQVQECDVYPGYTKNPLQENQFNPIPGLLHKYHGRVLLTLSGGCAINCRYCFRRHFPYDDNVTGMQGWLKAIEYISNDASITEVILSGGDPLIVKDVQLKQLIVALEKIPHVKRLRIHSRLPVVLPTRITDEFISILSETRLQVIMVIHCNHANEIDGEVISVLNACRNKDIVVLNQTVLLKNINDTVDALVNLSDVLFSNHIIPYYLHVLDPVQGAAHFDITEERARALVWEMMQQLPGYMVPKLVREQPGFPAKMPIYCGNF